MIYLIFLALGRHHMTAAFFKRHKLICINVSLTELTGGLIIQLLSSGLLSNFAALKGKNKSRGRDNLHCQMERGRECSVHHPKIRMNE